MRRMNATKLSLTWQLFSHGDWLLLLQQLHEKEKHLAHFTFARVEKCLIADLSLISQALQTLQWECEIKHYHDHERSTSFGHSSLKKKHFLGRAIFIAVYQYFNHRTCTAWASVVPTLNRAVMLGGSFDGTSKSLLSAFKHIAIPSTTNSVEKWRKLCTFSWTSLQK